MGNPQERSLAWLAGVLESEGSISVQAYVMHKKGGNLRLTPFICLVNTDQAIIAESVKLISEMLIGDDRAKPRVCKASGTNKICSLIRLDGTACKIVLEALLPYMIGEKRKNAQVVIDYINGRKQNLFIRDRLGRLQRNGYTKAEVELISSIRQHKTAKSSETLCQAPNVLG